MLTKTKGMTDGDNRGGVSLQATAIVEGRADICTLAGLLKFFELNGVTIGTKSMLLREITETLMMSLVENGLAERITDLEEASRIMARLATHRDKRVFGNLGKAISQQRSDEVDTEEMKRAALEWLKVNDPVGYEKAMKTLGYGKNEYVSGDGPPKVNNTVPDLMPLIKEEN